MSKSKRELPEQKTPRPFWARVIVFGLNAALIGAFAISLYFLYAWIRMPSLDSMLAETRQPSITFVDSAGYEIRTANKIMGTPVSVKTLPPHVWQAIVAIEDKRFFEHGAFDARGIMRSLIANARAGAVVAGGSSLTQQTAKNIFLNPRRTVLRKVQELLLAQWLENRFDKNQILDLYMNRVSLVGGLRGIDAAARDLFSKTADELTLAESAQIAAMLKAPTAYNPRTHADKNKGRATVILKEMVRQKYITIDAARDAAAALGDSVSPPADTNEYRYWTDYVTDEIASRLGGKVGDDLIVYTTLDSDLQDAAARAVRTRVADYKNKSVGQGALVALARDGAIRSMVGGTRYQDSQFNRTLAMRQPGSAFKSVVYLVALENGMTPDDYVNDSQISIGDYKPSNYNEKYYGDIKMSEAFARSVNSVPLKLTREYGIDSVLKMSGKLGVGAKLKREYSTVLGGSEMTLLDLTTMYDVIYNGGKSVAPYAIERVVTPSGRVLYARAPGDPITVLSENTVVEMQMMLADVVRGNGTARRANAPGVLGGKTGTSNDYRDAWFVGATENLVVGAWVGNDDFSPMLNITGGLTPAEIFHDFVVK